MGKGSNTSTSNTTTAPNPQAMQAYSDLMAKAQGIAATPYTPYGGEIVAPFNAQQNTGVAGINDYANFAQPYIQQAAGLATNAASPITAAQIQQYESPYTQQVVDATQKQFNSQNATQMQGVKGNAIAQGALGGNREAIAEAETANQQQLAQAPVIAGLRNQGYQTGLNTALTQQQAQAAGAYSLGNLGVSGQNAGLTGATAQLGAGTAQQQTQQAKDAAAYQQFLTQQAYPFQTAQWLAGIDTGVGSQMGGTSSGSQTGPAPSMLGQFLGAGTSAAGILGGTGAFGSAGWLTALMSTGGAVGRAQGGGVAPEQPETVPEPHETLVAQQHQLIDGHRRVQMFPRGTRELALPHGISRIVVDGEVFHYDPNRISAEQIRHASANGRENELLDLGQFSKHDIMHRLHNGEMPVAVVERRPDGTEVRAAAGTHVTAQHQMAMMHHTKSPGNTLHFEDPRHTLSHRMKRAYGGSVQHFDTGGGVAGLDMSGTPYAGAKGYVPGMNITRGQGAPHASAPGIANQPASDPAKMGAQIGAMAKAISGGFNNKPMDISTPAQGPFTPSPVGTVAPIGLSPETFTPTELSGSDGAVYRRGGMVGSYAGGGVANLPTHNRIMMPHGYADGGLARAGQMFNAGAKDWWESGPQRVYSDFQGNGDSTNRGGFDNRQNLIDKYKTEDSTLAADEQPEGRALGGVAHGYADGGMPYDNGIPFDPTAGGIAPGPDQFNVDNSVNAIAQDILSGGAPLRKSAGFDRGISGPQDASPLDTAPWPSGPVNSPGAVVDGNGPSPLDTAPWPSGPAGAPLRKGDREPIVGQPTFNDRFSGVSPSLADQGVSGASVPLGALTSPGFGGAPSAPVTGMKAVPLAQATDIATPTAGYADNMERIAAAHRQIESHGDYGLVGQANPKNGDRAYGAYQVMGANVPVWTKEYLGRSMTPQEFLHDKNAQDAVYKARMGQYIGQYGLNGALDHWLGMGKSDFTGTTHPQYQQKFMTALNGSAEGAGGSNGVAGDTRDIPPKAMLSQSTPENTGVAAPANGIDWSGNSKLWPALMAAGAGMMSSRSPFLGNAVGEGIQSGMGQYSAEKQQEMKQHQIDLEAKRLSQQADFQQKELALKNLPYSQMTEYQKAQIRSTDDYRKALGDRSNFRPSGAMTEDGHPIHTDTRTGESIDAITGEPVAAGAKVIPSGRGGTGASGGVWKVKHDAWLTAHPNDEAGALEYAAGHRQMSPFELNKAAGAMAQRDMNANILLATKPQAVRDAEMDRLTKKYKEDLREGMPPAPQGAAAPAAVPPTAAAAASATASAAAAAPPPPPRPPTVAANAQPQYNTKTKDWRWKGTDGSIYSADGSRIQ